MSRVGIGQTAKSRFLIHTFGAKYPKAVKSLTKDAEELLTFYDFPAAHFQHIRMTNPIELSFSTIRLRTKKDEVLWQPEKNAIDDVQIILRKLRRGGANCGDSKRFPMF